MTSFPDLGLTAAGSADADGGCGGDSCGCGHADASATGSVTPAGAVSTTFGVTGMTCAHCASAVTDELSALGGVESVSIDLQPGDVTSVTVTSDAPLEASAVRAAVEDAGYQLADA